jgi:putative hydrolase of the HAD superfamily
VIFDLGGVVLDSPLEAFFEFEARHGVSPGSLSRVVVGSGEAGAWARLERGELDLSGFYLAFDAELATAGVGLSSAALMAEVAERTHVRWPMVEAIRRIRRSGRKVGALTNNWVSDDGQYDRMQALVGEFDAFVESCKVGLRKPDARIYELACSALGVQPRQAVFLDDIGSNLKAARALGMHTLKVNKPEAALAELGAVLGLELC